MPVEMLTYAELGKRLNCSAEAARALVKRLRLPRQLASDGKALVAVDVANLAHKPMPIRLPADHRPVTAMLKARVDALQAMLVKLEATAAGHRLDFERERERADRLMAELLRATVNTNGQPKKSVTKAADEPRALLPRSWWRRMAG